MNNIVNFPLFVLALSLFAQWLSELIGGFVRERWDLQEDERDDFRLIVASTLTLLALIIGFTFSMAITRYDLRKHYEAEEANAISTEYVRSDLLPAADGARVRALLRDYLNERIRFYEARDQRRIPPINASTAQLQAALWSAVQTPAVAQPTAVAALVVSGMNDVLNSQGYSQAAWWNRIPGMAWGLMAAIALCSNLLIGYDVRHARVKAGLLLVLPIVISVSFFLISDIDSPRGGVIRVRPQNLASLAQSMRGR